MPNETGIGIGLLDACALVFEVEARLDDVCCGPKQEFNKARTLLLYDAILEFFRRMPNGGHNNEVLQDIIDAVIGAEYGCSNISDEMLVKYGRGDW